MGKMVKCGSCQTEISKDASACPKCGAPCKKKMGCIAKGVIIFIGLIVLSGIIQGISGNKAGSATGTSTSSSGASSTSSAPAPSVAIPADQQAFINAIVPLIKEYSDAPNELKKSAVRTKRKEAIQATIKSFDVNGWVGTLKKLATTSDGKAYIEIGLAGTSAIFVKTFNNGLSDIGSNTLIDQKSPLFEKLSNMKKGAMVTFNGTFLKGDKDYLLEVSITEAGSMSEPEFVMVFTDVTAK